MEQTDKQRAPRKEREMEQHRLEILAAAEEVFMEKGYVSTSMEEVARCAEFSVGTLYNFFRNKEDLYAELLRQKALIVRRQLEEALARGATPREKIENYFRAHLELYWQHRAFIRLFLHQAMCTIFDLRAGFTPELVKLYEEFLHQVETVFDAGIAAGQFRPLGAAVLTLAMEGIVHAYVARLSRMDSPRRNGAEEEHLLQLFFAGAAPSTPAPRTVHSETPLSRRNQTAKGLAP